jgi:membrane fusion protein, copper/silver efflux system
MNSIPKYLIVIAVLLAAFLCFTTACKPSAGPKGNGTLYTCPMHPEIRQDEPGKCPICHMDLVPAEKPAEKLNVDSLLDPVNRYVVSDAAAVMPFSTVRQRTLEVQGTIGYDERLVNTVSSRVDGRIEKLYVKYPYQPVTAGQRLFDIYSPELQNEQENFIYLLRSEAESSAIVASARARLALLGFTDEQISTIASARRTINPVTYFSPYTGHFHIPEPGAANDVMGMTTGSATAPKIQEGMYVKKGQVLFQINNTARVWALLNIGLVDGTLVKTGDPVVIQVRSEKFPARIEFIEPALKDGQRFITARAYLDNRSGSMKIGENISAVIQLSSGRRIFLPVSAVVSLGTRSVVFVQEGKRFRAQEVRTGLRAGQFIEVLFGLDSATAVAKNASYLADSESFLDPDE